MTDEKTPDVAAMEQESTQEPEVDPKLLEAMQKIVDNAFAKAEEMKGEDPMPVWKEGQDVVWKATSKAAKVHQVFSNGTVEIAITEYVTVSARDLR